MTEQLFQGCAHINDHPVENATVFLYEKGTLSPVLAATITDPAGQWTILFDTEKPIDVETICGSLRVRTCAERRLPSPI